MLAICISNFQFFENVTFNIMDLPVQCQTCLWWCMQELSNHLIFSTNSCSSAFTFAMPTYPKLMGNWCTKQGCLNMEDKYLLLITTQCCHYINWEREDTNISETILPIILCIFAIPKKVVKNNDRIHFWAFVTNRCDVTELISLFGWIIWINDSLILRGVLWGFGQGLQ